MLTLLVLAGGVLICNASKLESYDVTSVRASTPMFLMARKIRAAGCKMVLSGEGADEAFGGYLYFHHAPSARELHEETKEKLQALHLFDCNRANKATAAWGVEARVPFLDRCGMSCSAVGRGVSPPPRIHSLNLLFTAILSTRNGEAIFWTRPWALTPPQN